jgi:hypothetical protein
MQHIWARVEVHTGFWLGDLREDHLEYPGVDGMIILKCIFKKWDRGMDWIDTARHRDRWRGLLYTKEMDIDTHIINIINIMN